ncbi:MAG TPA: hypothetical protein VMX94_03070 [Armatimonadota bacterium]|nr:hypothetical protein [Armatimonadota bacterium]
MDNWRIGDGRLGANRRPVLKQHSRKWTRIGWQGLTIPVPADWHLGCVQGTRAKGYLRIDDDEHARAEIRWEKTAGKPEPFGKLADRMLSQLEKLGRKKGQYTIKRDIRLASPAGRESTCYEMKGQELSLGCLLRCEKCGRIVIGRLTGGPRDELRGIAVRLFDGLADHPEDDGLDHWDVYDLRFALSPEYELQQTKMRTGSLEMVFTTRKKTVDIRRISLASIVLKERSLKNFFVNYCYGDLKTFDYQAEEIPVKDHPQGVGLFGRQTLKARVLSHNIARKFVHAYSWLCEDRIYIVRMVTPLEEDPEFFELAEKVECHRKEQDERRTMNDER